MYRTGSDNHEIFVDALEDAWENGVGGNVNVIRVSDNQQIATVMRNSSACDSRFATENEQKQHYLWARGTWDYDYPEYQSR